VELLVVPPPEPDSGFMFPCGMCGYLNHNLVRDGRSWYFTCGDCLVLLAAEAVFRDPLVRWNLPVTWHLIE
jgi:hypothetical protein